MIGRKNLSLTSDEINALIDVKIDKRLAAKPADSENSLDRESIQAVVDARIDACLAELLPRLVRAALPGWIRRMQPLLGPTDFVTAFADRQRELHAEVDPDGALIRWVDSTGTEMNFPNYALARFTEEAKQSLGLDSNSRAPRDPFAEAIAAAQRAANWTGTPPGVEDFKVKLAQYLQDVGRATVVEAG